MGIGTSRIASTTYQLSFIFSTGNAYKIVVPDK